MRRAKRQFLTAIVVLPVTIVLALTSSAGAAGSPLIIGAAIDMTSFMSPFDTPALAAAKIAAEKVNAAGGINGQRIVFKTCNTQSKPDLAKSCAARLLSQGAEIGWVTGDADFAGPAVQEFIGAGKLTLSAIISTDQMGRKRFGPKGRLAFSFGNLDRDEGAAMAEYAISRGWKTAVVVKENLLIYTKDVADAFATRFAQKGGKVVGREAFTHGDGTINTVISRVAQHKADVIAFCEPFSELPTFVAGIRSLGNKTPLVSCGSGDGNYWWPKKPAVTNFHYTTFASLYGDDPNPAVDALLKKLKSRGVKPSTSNFLAGAAAIEGLAYAVEKAGTTDAVAVAKTLDRFRNVPTISGKITFSPMLHTVFGREYRIMNVENNKARFVRLFKASSPAKLR